MTNPQQYRPQPPMQPFGYPPAQRYPAVPGAWSVQNGSAYFVPYYPPAAPVDPYQRDANCALGWGLAALLFNFLGVPSICAIVCGLEARKSYDPNVRSRAEGGIVLGILGLIAPIVLALYLLGAIS